MLVLTIKEGEAVVVGDTVVTMERIGKGRAKVSFKGPRGTPVLRGKLMELPRMGSGQDLPDLALEAV